MTIIGEDVEKLDPSYMLLASVCKYGAATLENSLAIPHNAKYRLILSNPETPLLSIYPREMKTYIHT